MPEKVAGSGKNIWRRFGLAEFLLLLCLLSLLLAGCARPGMETTPVNIPLLEKWSGDYPVAELDRLPEGQRDRTAGYIGDAGAFVPVWRAFMPDDILPSVDFSRNFVVFTRNTQFYNRIAIFKVEMLPDGTAVIAAMETMSARPIEDRVAMSMAVIPRSGVTAIEAGGEKTRVFPRK